MGHLANQVLEFMRTEVISRKNSSPNIKDKAYIFTKDDIYNNFDCNREDIDDVLKSLVGEKLLKKWILGTYKLLDED